MKRIRYVLALGLGMLASVAYAKECGCSSSQLSIDALAQAEATRPAAKQASWLPWQANRYEEARRNFDVFLLAYSSAFNADYAGMTAAERAKHYQVLNNLRLARIRHMESLAGEIAAHRHDPRAVDVLRAHATSLTFTADQRREFLADGLRWLERAEASPDTVLQLAAQRVREGCVKAGNPDLRVCFTAALTQAGPTDPGHLTTYALPSGPLTSIVARFQQLEAGRQVLGPQPLRTASR